MKMKRIPERMCLACRTMHTRDKLLRLVRRDNGIVLDLSNRLNGRGAYVCVNEDCINKLFDKDFLKRNLQAKPVDDLQNELLNQVEKLNAEIIKANRQPKVFKLSKDGKISEVKQVNLKAEDE